MTTNIKWYLDYKRIFYLILTISWVSGVIFFVLNSFFTVEGEFGIGKTSLTIFGIENTWWLIIFNDGCLRFFYKCTCQKEFKS